MVWISLFMVLLDISWSAELPKFLTKHSIDSVRFITMDGRFAYIKKRPGVLGLVTSFRSTDFISDQSGSDFIVKGSHFKKRLSIEIIPSVHGEFNLFKKNKIVVVDWGQAQTKEIGLGVKAKLHLQDEWISFYDPIEKLIHLKNIITEKKYSIQLSGKTNPYFRPEVEMGSSDIVTYTDINEKGYSAFISYNLLTQNSTVLYRSPMVATRLELCRSEDYLAIGEFPFEGLDRGSRIMHIKLTSTTNLAGYQNIYNSGDSDVGNMVCHPNSIFFIKTMSHQKFMGSKISEAAKLDIKTFQVEAKTSMEHVTQLINMDDRILIPSRGEYFVLEGRSNLSSDTLKSTPTKSEELPLEI